MKKQKEFTINKKRAYIKTGFVLAAILFLVAVLSYFVSDQDLDTLKHSLDLGTVIALLVIINLVSFACFLVLFSAYQWIRDDLKPERDDELPS